MRHEARRRLPARVFKLSANLIFWVVARSPLNCQYVCIDITGIVVETRRVNHSRKNSQLQIRVSRSQKSAIQKAARQAGMEMSAYVLMRVLSIPAVQFRECVEACAGKDPAFALAELNSLLSGLTSGEMRDATAAAPTITLTPYIANYVAAMVEYGCARCSIAAPAWTRAIEPLSEPVFATTLKSLRLHLLTQSPPPFRFRNIFIDASLGSRV